MAQELWVFGQRRSEKLAYFNLQNVDVDFQMLDGGRRRLFHPEAFPNLLGGRLGLGTNNRLIVSALSDVTLEIKNGARVGVIGHNGAGKSTLLRLLAGIYHPTRGTILRDGDISPVFNTNLGMEEDFTGFENIRMSGLLFGMTSEEIEEVTPEIAEFTELQEYLNLPIRTYSDGMRARLSFAIATAKHPEILLMDEGIGAGDAAFQSKVAKRIEEFTSRTKILVLASHSNELIKSFCTTGLLLERGSVIFYGDIDDAVVEYEKRIGRWDQQ